MKIEFSTENKEISKLLEEVDKVVEELDPDDAPQIHCGFLVFEMLGDLINYWFGTDL